MAQMDLNGRDTRYLEGGELEWTNYDDAAHTINLGAGVQSSTLLFLADRGIIGPKPEVAIFADTGAEPKSVYKWLDYLRDMVDIPIEVVQAKQRLQDHELVLKQNETTGKTYRRCAVPAFTEGSGMLLRKCTRDFKVYPILRRLKERFDVPRVTDAPHVIQWIGISTDEAARMKPSGLPWSVHRWPLIEENWSRLDCLAWWEKEGLPAPPRSACVFCPYHSDAEWLRLKTEEPKEFERAVEFERSIQAAHLHDEVSTGKPFLHSSRRPLDEVPLDPSMERGYFDDECEGMCGV